MHQNLIKQILTVEMRPQKVVMVILKHQFEKTTKVLKRVDFIDTEAKREVSFDEISENKPNTKDYSYYCYMCNEDMPDLKSVLEHRKSVHNIKYNLQAFRKDINVVPDIQDPNHYFRSCQYKYPSLKLYRLHIKRFHFLRCKSLRERQRGDIIPDSEDPNLYSYSCDYTFRNKKYYNEHLRRIHKMKLHPLCPRKNPNILPDWNNPDSYCISCKKTYKNFKFHCRNIHCMKASKIALENRYPDPNDPNYHWKICDITFEVKDVYKTHCQSVHGIKLANPDLLNTDELDNYCRVCDKTLPTKVQYKNHLSSVQKKTSLVLDIDDPNFYCRVCKQRYRTKQKYRNHLRGKHKMMLPPLLKAKYDPNFLRTTWNSIIKHFVYPNAVIDIHSTDFYCAKCNHYYYSKFGFQLHL